MSHFGYALDVRLHLAAAASSTCVDLNAVRLQTLDGAVCDARRRISLYAYSPPAWLDGDERACWGFTLGQVEFALACALRDIRQKTAGAPPLETYRATLDAVTHVTRVCLREAEPQSRGDLAAALALETAADELAPIVRHADRAPRWLRERAQRAFASAAARGALDP